MLSKEMQKALNEQVNAEFWSAYLYLSMSVDAADKGYKGVANWFAVQFKEEQAHAQIFMNYLLSRGARINLAPIAEVQTEWASPLEMFRATLEHEKKVTAMIHNLCHIAADEHDFASSNMLAWFVDEQIEEEENAQDLIAELEKVDDSKLGLYMVDKELAARTYTVPAPLAGKE
ncbi:MAG: ferritin [Alistipes sp.]|nr:ferritin [Alistipes sp.]